MRQNENFPHIQICFTHVFHIYFTFFLTTQYSRSIIQIPTVRRGVVITQLLQSVVIYINQQFLCYSERNLKKLGDNMIPRNRIEEFRTNLKMTQEELGELLGLTQQQVSHYEVRRREPKVGLALKFAQHLGTTVEELFIV